MFTINFLTEIMFFKNFRQTVENFSRVDKNSILEKKNEMHFAFPRKTNAYLNEILCL